MGTVKFEDFKKEVKKRELIDKGKAILRSAYDHRYEIAGGVVSALMVIKTATGVVNNVRDRLDDNRKIYDHSAGHYWKTKRQMTNSDYLEMEEIRRRYKCTKGEALKMMGLLRK